MNGFEHLHVWQRATELIREIYRLTGLFPAEEKFVLVMQMRRSSTSILANTAEGLSRTTPADKAYKFTIARGECTETKAFLLASIAVGYIAITQADRACHLLDETGKMLSGLIRRYEK
ncbi:MAG: four helix bundle protein [Candidatus Peregrinibacteria bacterium]